MRRFVVVLSSSFIVFFVFLFNIHPLSKFEENNKITTSESNESTNYDGCSALSYDGSIISGSPLAYFEGKEIEVPQIAFVPATSNVLGATSEEKWIEVDLSEQKLTAWEGNTKYLETLISSGLPWTPTPTGEFRIWIKLRSTKMEGGQGKYYYYLPNVPYVMYFANESVPSWKGYGIHGAYWHNDFGKPHSHGCVNVPTDTAGKLYSWVTPDLGNSKWGTKSSTDNLGTRIIIHE